MINILKCISSLFIIIPILYYGLSILINSHKKISDDTGFNITKDIISEYNTINIIENTGIISYYNLKRKIIKLSKNSYYGNNLSYISIALLSASISVIDKNKNQYLTLIKKVVNNLKLIYLLPLITIIIPYITYTKLDAQFGLIIILLSTIILYIQNNILSESFIWINSNIKKIKSLTKDNRKKVLNYLQKIINLNKYIFLGELVMIIIMLATLIKR